MRRAFGSLLFFALALGLSLLSGPSRPSVFAEYVFAEDEANSPSAAKPRKEEEKSGKPAQRRGDQNRPRTAAGDSDEGKKPAEKPPEKSPEKAKPTGKPEKNASDKPTPDKPDKSTKPAPEKTGTEKPSTRPAAGKAAPEKAAEKPDVALTAGREAAAMTFAHLHHPELADLLEQLKKRNKNEYERALRELFQTSEKLAKIKERSPDRYEAAVAAWKIDSRIRLLSARMVMSENPALEAEMRELLRQKAEHRIAELRAERERITARIDKIDDEISALESDPTAAVQRELQKLRFQVSEQSRALKRARDKID